MRTCSVIKLFIWFENRKNSTTYFMLFILHLPVTFFSIQVRMSWKFRDNKNLFLKLKSKMGFYHSVSTTQKPPKKLTLNAFEMPQSPDIEQIESKEEISCINWTKDNGRRNECAKHNTDTDNLKIVGYRYRRNLYLKNNENYLKLTKYQSLWRTSLGNRSV